MKLKSDEQRVEMLAYLSTHASLDELIELVSNVVERKKRYLEDYRRLSQMIERPTSAVSAPTTQSKEPVQTPVEEKAVTEPPGTAAGRIGAATKIAINKVLSQGPLSPRDINARINGKTDNTNSLLKLLWKRGEVKWDGEKYYV